ncbi:MAG: prolipoprotein diacylglyceryl transferase [Oscillospiraceae bacterium]|jgi:phosphatidylglycerol:prolipoprotein diacylglycerol transferase|nr:prolipoprotein diacylglyceryl transferase [Oscillospiraceae bacterium]
MSIPPLGSEAFWGIPWYSLLIVAGMAIGAALAIREEPRLGLPRDSVMDSILLAIPMAIVGARLYYVAFEWELYRDDLLRILRVREGGLAVYGGILGGLLAAWIMSRIRRAPFLKILDACAPSLMLGQAIGRWGNYANMEAYGLAVNDPGWQWFPFAVRIPIAGNWMWFMATFFYESVWCFAGFIALRKLRYRLSRSGDVFLWYVLIYGVGRTFIEGLRLDSLMIGGTGIRVSQILSLTAVAAVAAAFALRGRIGRHGEAVGIRERRRAR